MGSVSIWHWIVVGIVIMLMFGRGKVSDLMADVAKGIKSFKKGMAEDETAAAAQPASAPVAPAPITEHVQPAAATEHPAQPAQASAAPQQPAHQPAPEPKPGA
jgi:sec-independent protein translocase protein TatA